MAYVDTSVLVAYYCPESGSMDAQTAMQEQELLSVSPLVEVELCSALSMKVRASQMTGHDADAVVAAFHSHLQTGVYRFLAIESRHFDQAAEWLRRRTTGLRSLDALHLAVAALSGETLLTADAQLADAARAVGVACCSP